MLTTPVLKNRGNANTCEQKPVELHPATKPA
jgi:hypothetical protein